MAMMLRHKTTGDVYIYTTLLAQRDDMEVFEQTPKLTPASKKEEPTPTPAATPAKLTATVKPVVSKGGE